MAKPSYLVRRRAGWYVKRKVPEHLRDRYGGTTHKVVSLRTRDRGEADRKKWTALDQIAREFEAVEKGAQIPSGDRPVRPEPAEIGLDLRPDVIADRLPPERITDQAEDYHKRTGDIAGARQLVRIASGEEEPPVHLSDLVESWLQEEAGRGIRQQTIVQHRAESKRFLRFARKQGALEPDAVSRRVAGKYVTDILLPLGKAPMTVNRYISSLSSWWRWLDKRGYLVQMEGVNPWEKQGAAKKASASAAVDDTDEQGRREFTTGELIAMLSTPATGLYAQAHPDMVRLGLLTGMRQGELCSLQVRDIDLDAGSLRVRAGKTAAARRLVPIHSLLRPLLERRLKGKAEPTQYLIEELNGSGPDQKRNTAFTKAFTRWNRQVVGITDKGAVYHSFRMTFIGMLERGGVPLTTVERMVGHKPQSLSFGTYSGGLELEQLQQSLENIAIPDAIQTALQRY